MNYVSWMGWKWLYNCCIFLFGWAEHESQELMYQQISSSCDLKLGKQAFLVQKWRCKIANSVGCFCLDETFFAELFCGPFNLKLDIVAKDPRKSKTFSSSAVLYPQDSQAGLGGASWTLRVRIWYRWWKKSGDHQLRLVVYPIIYRFLYIPCVFFGFLPSTLLCKILVGKE